MVVTCAVAYLPCLRTIISKHWHSCACHVRGVQTRPHAEKLQLQGDSTAAVAALMASTEELRPTFQERAASKRQKLEQPRGVASQGWFFEADTWLSGTGTSAEAAPIFFEDDEVGLQFVQPILKLDICWSFKHSCAL